jgi:hypothetical protein
MVKYISMDPVIFNAFFRIRLPIRIEFLMSAHLNLFHKVFFLYIIQFIELLVYNIFYSVVEPEPEPQGPQLFVFCMHYGFGSCSETEFGSGSNIKCIKKSKNQ